MNSEEIREALEESVTAIVAASKAVLEKTPPELSADIIDKGIIVTGGGAYLHGLDTLLTEELRVPVLVAEDPMSCVVKGTGIMLENLDRLTKARRGLFRGCEVMIRGIYTAAAGMLTQQARQDLLTNNLANINTPGYKQDQAMIRSFPDVLIQQIRVPVTGGQQAIGSIAQGVFMEENVPLFIQGDLIDTGVKTQMAIWDSELQPNPNQQTKPTLLFTIQDPEGGRAYTRSGLFTEDSQGQLVTSEGYLVLDDQGKPIQTNGREFTIDPKGTLQFTDGQTLRLGLTKIDNPNQLLKQGNQIYRLQGGKEIFLL